MGCRARQRVHILCTKVAHCCYKILTPSAAKVRCLISLIVGTTFSNVLRAYNGAVRGIVGSRRTNLTF